MVGLFYFCYFNFNVIVMTNSTKGILLAGITAFMWGLLAIALKVTLNYIDSYTIVWWRFAASFAILLVYILIRRPKELVILRRPPALLLLAGLFLGLNFIGFQEGVHYAGPAISQVIIQLGAITLAFVGFIGFREPSSPLKILGFILAAVGFFFFFFQQLNSVPAEAAHIKLGVIYLVAGAWTWTCYAILNKILVRKIPPIQINLILYAVPTLLYLPFVDFDALFQPHTLMIWLLLLFVALNTLIAYGSLSAALKYTEANKISIIVTLNPVITFIIMESLLWFDVSWFDSPGMTPLTYMGAAMVLGGAILAVGAKSRGSHRPHGKI